MARSHGFVTGSVFSYPQFEGSSSRSYFAHMGLLFGIEELLSRWRTAAYSRIVERIRFFLWLATRFHFACTAFLGIGVIVHIREQMRRSGAILVPIWQQYKGMFNILERAADYADTNAKLLLTLHSFFVSYQKSLRSCGRRALCVPKWLEAATERQGKFLCAICAPKIR